MVIWAKNITMIDNKIPVSPGLFEVRPLMSQLLSICGSWEWHCCDIIEGDHLQPTHKHMAGKQERWERFMSAKFFFSWNIRQAYHRRVEFYGPTRPMQALRMIPALIPEKVMLLTWNWTPLMMSQQSLDPFFAVLGNGLKSSPNLKL